MRPALPKIYKEPYKVKEYEKDKLTECERLEKENERLEFYLKDERDAYGSDVLDVLSAVSEGRMSKLKAHQRLNKCYKERYEKLQRVLSCAEEYLTATESVFMMTNDDDCEEGYRKTLQQAIADYEKEI